MSDPQLNPELLPSLARLVRGLSALFWGLPIALVVCVQAAWTDALHSFGLLPPVAVTGWLLFGLWELGHFQKQERVWQRALDRAKLIALAVLGLAPFLYWWSHVPYEPFFNQMALMFLLGAVLLLGELNLVLRRLTAMLPDASLWAETRQFTGLNRLLLLVLLAFTAGYLYLDCLPPLPAWFIIGVETFKRKGLLLLFLLPLAMTMALLWKTKETILDGVFKSKD
jgi:hypothetical protein